MPARRPSLLEVSPDAPPLLPGTAPLLGQHRNEVLQELGYSASEISALEAEGAI